MRRVSHRRKHYTNIGDKFGRWTVTSEEIDNKVECLCECGERGLVKPAALCNGGSKQCGKCGRKTNIKYNIMIGEKYGSWTIVEVKNNSNITASCKCGATQIFCASTLIGNSSSMCLKCSFEKSRKYKVSIGDQYNKWKVLELSTKENEYNTVCQCICGYIGTVRVSDLVNGHNKGCIHCAQKDRIGKYMKERKYIPTTFMSFIKSNAKRRNLDFDLTIDYLDQLLEQQNFKCALSGIELKIPDKLIAYSTRSAFDRKNSTISLDRIDSSKGYVQGNVQWVHKIVNIMKWSMTDDQFVTLCTMVANHNKGFDALELDEIQYSYTQGIKIRNLN